MVCVMSNHVPVSCHVSYALCVVHLPSSSSLIPLYTRTGSKAFGEKHYGHFRGTLASDKPNKIYDNDMGLEYDVVGVRKIVVELYEDKTKTVNLDTGHSTEVASTGENVLTDTGNQHFGQYTLKASTERGAHAGKMHTLKKGGLVHVDCVLSPELQEKVPFPQAFSRYQHAQRGTNVVVNNNNYAKNRKPKRGLRPDGTVNERLDVSVSRAVSGTRTDVYAAKVGTEVTVIGDFSPNLERTAWVAVSSPGRLTDVTLKTFDQYKADKIHSATVVNNVGTGLIVLGSAFGIAGWSANNTQR